VIRNLGMPPNSGHRPFNRKTLGCATKGAEDQWMRVPPEQLSVRLGSYPGGGMAEAPEKEGAL
jgi:hypothetical protein